MGRFGGRATFFMAFVAGMAVTALIKRPPIGSSDWASWIQAIGAIGAIIFTVVVGERQRQAAVDAVANAQLLAEKSQRKSALAIAGSARDRAVQFEEALNKPDFGSLALIYSPLLISTLSRALLAVPVHQIGSPVAIRAFLELQFQYELLGGEIDIKLAGPHKDPVHMALRRQADGLVLNEELVLGNFSKDAAELVHGWQSTRNRNIQTYINAIKQNYDLMRDALDA